jgi:tetratricopeptide (TPR) repeat protein
MTRTIRLLLGLLVFAALASTAAAKPPTEEQEKMVRDVFKKLTDKMERVPGFDVWPPEIDPYDDDKVPASERFNAFASTLRRGAQVVPIVRISEEYLSAIVRGDRDVLANILGHELGHIKHKHVVKLNPGKTDVTYLANVRTQEYEADSFGGDLAKKAGFSVLRASILQFLRDKEHGEALEKRYPGWRYHGTPLDRVARSHPAWSDRFARINQDPRVWEALAEFENGTALLAAEQFFSALKCFEKVLAFDPNCCEAHVNRGYAYLMLYCDGFTAKDLKDYGVGHFVCGAFYRRAKSLEPPVRGADRKLWDTAVDALQEALKRKPGLPMARATLGLAYLVHPDGKEAPKAVEELSAAQEALKDDPTITDFERAVVRINLGVAQMAAGKKGSEQFDAAMALVRKLYGEESGALFEAIRYNQALALADAGRVEDAVKAFDAYLRGSDSYPTWWSLAYDRYAELCKQLGQSPADRETLLNKDKALLRRPVSVTFADGKTVTIAEKIGDVLKNLGEHDELALADTRLKRYRFKGYPVEVLATDRVVAIVLNSKASPPVILQPRGAGSGKPVELRVGMSRARVLETLPGARSVDVLDLVDTDRSMRYGYYRRLGLGIRYSEDYPNGDITELVLVEVPES